MTSFDIEKNILDLFCDDTDRTKFKAVDVQSGITALTRPGMTVAVVSGNYDIPDNSGRIRQTAKVVVTIVVKNVAKEIERRKVMHPSVDYVIRKLYNNDLGLEIEPMTAKSWREVTNEEYLVNGLMVAEIEFETAYDIQTDESEKEYRLLESILSNFEIDEDEVLQGRVDFNNGVNHDN